MAASASLMMAVGVQAPRLAPDAERESILRAAWRDDPIISAAAADGATLHSQPHTYRADVTLHGRLDWAEWADDGIDGGISQRRPAVLLVHTAVGPRDVWLMWRAQSLASLGYVVLTADCFGDELGNCWEPAIGAAAREPLTADRSLLRRRLQCGLDELSAHALVDRSRLAALGWCFGGRGVLELARASPLGLRAVVSFHGILDASPVPAGVYRIEPRLLLCHGDDDAFVAEEDVSACLAQLRQFGARWSLLRLGGAKHGFTNPAQRLNPNEKFDFDQSAAEASWEAAMSLLREELGGLAI